jgi:hypothetical protein
MMKYTQVLNPIWANAEHTAINCDVDFDDLREELVPFTAVASGDYEHSHQIYAECVAGNYGEIAEYVAPPVPEYVAPPEPTKEQLLAELAALTAKIEALGA